MSKIQKATGATTNTYITIIKGMSINPDTMVYQNVNVSVMFTSDRLSETLSLTDPSTKKQIVVPFKEIDELIDHVREKRKDK